MGCVMSSSTPSRTISAWPDLGCPVRRQRQTSFAHRPVPDPGHGSRPVTVRPSNTCPMGGSSSGFGTDSMRLSIGYYGYWAGLRARSPGGQTHSPPSSTGTGISGLQKDRRRAAAWRHAHLWKPHTSGIPKVGSPC
jgi:hypothetical protein